jgi:hypothetical protein
MEWSGHDVFAVGLEVICQVLEVRGHFAAKIEEACAGAALCAHPEGTPPPVRMIARIPGGKNARFSIGECLLAWCAQDDAARVDGVQSLRF